MAIALAAALALATPAGAQAPGFSPQPWLADLAQLRDAMSAGYANLEWQAGRGLDLAALYERARTRLNAARDDAQARRTIERFLAAFGDGHLEVSWPAPPAAFRDDPKAGPEPLCERLGYFDVRADDGPALGLPGAVPVGTAAGRFKAAMVPMAGRKLGVLRIGSFLPKGYPDICEKVAVAQGLTTASPCDEACQDAFDRAADALFVTEMARQLQALAAARPDVVLVDIAGNGGGDDSSLALARMLTDKRLHRPRGGGLKGAAWAKALVEREADVAKALPTAPAAQRTALQRFDDDLKAARARALSSPCDRSPLWSGRAIGCSAMVPEPLYEGFWSSVPAPDDPVVRAQTLWRGPVIVLVDGDSASSSEWLAAMLQDAHAALILGSPTAGAGCGHMTDAPPVTLAHSGGRISMPDCWRLRADGENEAGGIEPDVLIGFRDHDPLRQKTLRLARKLPEALTRLARP